MKLHFRYEYVSRVPNNQIGHGPADGADLSDGWHLGAQTNRADARLGEINVAAHRDQRNVILVAQPVETGIGDDSDHFKFLRAAVGIWIARVSGAEHGAH